MPFESSVIPLAALIVSLAALLRGASRDRVDILYKEIERIRDRLKECEAARERLMTENLDLMKRVLQR
jgi:hypothetical protein